MIFWHVFLHSLKLPNKQAMFRLNRTGMDITVIYMFILLFFVSTPSLVDRIMDTTGTSANMNIVFLLIYFFIFYYLPLVIIIFLLLCVVAYIGTGVARFMGRKLRFAILWKMSAYTTTIPFLVYTILSFFVPVSNRFLLVFSLYTFILLIKIISVYPKRRIRS